MRTCGLFPFLVTVLVVSSAVVVWGPGIFRGGSRRGPVFSQGSLRKRPYTAQGLAALAADARDCVTLPGRALRPLFQLYGRGWVCEERPLAANPTRRNALFSTSEGIWRRSPLGGICALEQSLGDLKSFFNRRPEHSLVHVLSCCTGRSPRNGA